MHPTKHAKAFGRIISSHVLLPSNKNAYQTLHVISLECKKKPPEGVKPILSKLKNNLSKDRYPHNFVMSKKKELGW